ncbi:MAG: MFS transporter [Halobacteriota archaeon]
MKVFASLRQEARALLGGGKGKLLVPIAVGWGMLIGTRMIYPVLLPYFRTEFDLSLTAAGLLMTILWLGAALGQLPGGILADRHSERKVMTASTILVALALVFVVTASTPVVLFTATGLVGLALSLYPIARITALSDIYPDRIGSALGVTMATGDLGQTVLPPVASVLAVAIAWQVGLSFVIPLFGLVGLSLWVTLPDKPSNDSAVDALSMESARYVLAELRRPTMILMALILFLFIFIWQSFSGFYPTYLVEVKGLSSSAAGVLFGLFFAFGVLVKPLSGAAYDRLGMRATLIVVLVGPVAGLVLLPFAEGFWPLAAVTALVSTMLGTGAITQSYLSDSFPAEMRGTGLGAIRTTAATLGSVGPVLFGLLADRGYFDEGYVALAAIMVVVILLTFRMPRG